MSDAADAHDDSDGSGDSEAAEQESDGAPSPAARFLALQTIDTESDQLATRLERLEERVARADAAAAMAEWERTLEAGDNRMAELATAIEDAERVGEGHAAQKARFEEQLKTIIAPREAEALMHEIETLDEQRDVNETGELEALEEQSSLDDALVAHRAAEQGHREALAVANAALAAAVAEITAAQEQLDGGRADARAVLDEAALRTYDRIRAHLGVAVAVLQGKMCTGCHLDLSAAEIDTARETAAAGTGLADCPQCGRMLVT
ncbi:MAG: C4-type zinc ribbon domain-containing protein [Acidimicrobiia bacterium]|nr:C4-type zinc ribbon domain-containing protein [Acidimicrobiia bacterium]